MKQKYKKHFKYKKKSNKSLINLTDNYKVYVANGENVQEELDVVITLSNLLGYNIRTYAVTYRNSYSINKGIRKCYNLDIRSKDKKYLISFKTSKNNNTLLSCTLRYWKVMPIKDTTENILNHLKELL